ncbi:alpha/beta hydrolase [Bacillus sp. CECT 9360]|uniref:alpha/beta hydrolase n=1 Tax=Bacillus sp. CECT 9360 TaxID=2845821 RepID=UPI001E3B2C75|nr:alpha/beta hydrolase [Bacillus sp. CECT 9360]CAH0346801.1 Phospholipase YtpA [Bacillus sp. CECT 9360]
MWKWEAEGNAKAVIVMIHGAMEHHGRYKWLSQMWRSSGYHVIMGDLPGQGMTTRAFRGHINSFDTYLNEVRGWIHEAYQYSLPVFLLGHSMGGLVAIRLLQEEEYDLAGVILSSPCLGLVTQPSKLLNTLSHGINLVYPKLKINADITPEIATRNPEVREADLNDSLYVTKVSVRWYRELVNAMKQAFDDIPYFEDVPLMLMQGGDDRVVDKRSVREWFNYNQCSEKHYKEWPGLYHEIFNEPEREDVFQYALGFVENRLKTLGYII